LFICVGIDYAENVYSWEETYICLLKYHACPLVSLSDKSGASNQNNKRKRKRQQFSRFKRGKKNRTFQREWLYPE